MDMGQASEKWARHRGIRILFLAAALLWSGCARPAPSPDGRAQGPYPVVALLTDFGTSDHYVGAMKGSILSACPYARVVDITHGVPPFDVPTAARVLYLAAREFPPGTVFVAVVDPGVGTPRRAVALRAAEDKIFVAPDNGLLTLVGEKLGVEEIRVIENEELFRAGDLSRTFQGRDVFGPVAGHLAAGTELADVGPLAGDLVRLTLPLAELLADAVRGRVERVDGYGNIITNIDGESLRELGISRGDTLLVRLGELELALPLLTTYGEVAVGAPLALIESTGHLELALNQGSLARRTGARAGARVEIRRRRAAGTY